MNAPARVLVVDDSTIVLRTISAVLGARADIEVVGSVTSAEAALASLASTRPHLVLMDAQMPGMDGLEGTRAIRARSAVSVVIMTAAEGAAFRRYQVLGIAAGANQVLRKGGVGTSGFYDKVACAAASAHVEAGPTSRSRSRPAPEVVGIVASTGGPQTLLQVLAPLPDDYSPSIVLVQHMATTFAESFRTLLQRRLHLEVQLTTSGDPLRPGHVHIAPPGSHVTIEGNQLRLDHRSPPIREHKPSGDRMLESLARSHGRRAWGLVLTGMGRDGATGLLALRGAGGHTLAQSGTTAIVDGMPKAARELHAAETVLHTAELGPYLARFGR